MEIFRKIISQEWTEVDHALLHWSRRGLGQEPMCEVCHNTILIHLVENAPLKTFQIAANLWPPSRDEYEIVLKKCILIEREEIVRALIDIYTPPLKLIQFARLNFKYHSSDRAKIIVSLVEGSESLLVFAHGFPGIALVLSRVWVFMKPLPYPAVVQ